MTANPETFRRRPIDVEAVQWTDTNADALAAFAGHRFMTIDPEDRIDDPDATASLLESAHESWALLVPGDWVVKRGDDFAVLMSEEFTDLYEPAGASGSDLIAKAVEALQARAGELQELAEEQMRPSLEERAQEWLEAAAIVQRIGRKGA